jgi:tetratricopeptide (TPR) repeat protein
LPPASALATKLREAARLCDDGRLDEARDAYLRILEEVEQDEGSHVHIAALNSYAGVVRDCGEFEFARSTYARAFELCRRNPDWRRDALALTVLSNFATIYWDLKEYAWAEALCRESLEHRRALLGDRHIDVAMSYHNLGTILSSNGDPHGAKAALLKAYEIDASAPGDRRAALATTFGSLGAVYIDLGDFGEAAASYKQAYEFRRDVFGSAHVHTAKSLRDWGQALIMGGRRTEGTERIDEYLGILGGWADKASAAQGYAIAAQIFWADKQQERARAIAARGAALFEAAGRRDEAEKLRARA